MAHPLSIYPTWQNAPELWESTARRVVVQGFELAKQNADLDRRALQQALHGFLDGDHRSELEARLAELYPKTAPAWNSNEAGHRYFPLVSMYADRLSVVFHREPETFIVGPDGQRLPDTHPQQLQWKSDRKALNLGITLQTVERWINSGMRQVLLSPCIRKDRIKWEVIAPYQAYVTQDVEEPGEIEGAELVQISLPQPNDSHGNQVEDLLLTWQRVDVRDERGVISGTQWFTWLHEESGVLKQNPLFADNVNRYGLHPFSVWRDGPVAPGDFWLDPKKGWYHQQLATDIKFCDMDHHLRHQIHSTRLVRGVTDAKVLEHGPDVSITTMETDASVEFSTPDPRINLLIDAINFDLRASAVAENLPADTFEARSSTRNLAAKQLEQAALEVRRERVVPFYLTALERTFEIHKRVSNYWASSLKRTRYDEGVTLGVELAPIPKVVDRFQDTQANTVDIQHNITSPVDVVMRREGVTRSEAERRLEARKADNERFGAKRESFSESAAGEGVSRPASVED